MSTGHLSITLQSFVRDDDANSSSNDDAQPSWKFGIKAHGQEYYIVRDNDNHIDDDSNYDAPNRDTIGMTLELEPLANGLKRLTESGWTPGVSYEPKADAELMEEDRQAAETREERKKAKSRGGLSCEYAAGGGGGSDRLSTPFLPRYRNPLAFTPPSESVSSRSTRRGLSKRDGIKRQRFASWVVPVCSAGHIRYIRTYILCRARFDERKHEECAL